MTDNEKIARWARIPVYTKEEFNKEPFSHTSVINDQIHLVLGADGDGLFIPRWNMAKKRVWWKPWSPSTDIALWHGEDGLFARIIKRDQLDAFTWSLVRFLNRRFNPNRYGVPMLSISGVGAVCCATAAQLTRAIVSLIESKNEASSNGEGAANG